MFQEETCPTVSIPSSLREKRCVTTGESQTETCKYENSEAQAGTFSNAESQTDPILPPNYPKVSYDEGKLAEFLTRICPKVLDELDKAHRSRAFDRYTSAIDEDSGTSRKLHTLYPSSCLPVECKLNSLAWSCTGAVLALGYGSVEHESWCNHGSKICIFNIDRPNFSSSTPSQILETKSCVTCLRGHVNESSILAAGLFNGDVMLLLTFNLGPKTTMVVPMDGSVSNKNLFETLFSNKIVYNFQFQHPELAAIPTLYLQGLLIRPYCCTFTRDVLIWNLHWEEDSLLGSSETAGGGHEDTIVHLSWIIDPSVGSDAGASKLVLASAGTDGRLIIWRLASQTGGLRRSQGFGIMSSHLSQPGKPSVQVADEFLPITCFDFLPNDPTSFVVAVESGTLLRCSTLSSKRIPGLDPEIVLSDPVIGSFKSHNGRISDVKCSPDRHNIFISCSSDGEIRVYNFQQTSPLHVIQFDRGAVNGLSWSPANSGVFLCWSEDSQIYLYDLNKTSLKPALHLESNDNHIKVNFAVYNPHSARTVAVADDDGHVNVWYLSEN